jgi:hypothetical protein
MRIGTSSRSLTPKEQALATRVFGPTLMPWNRILIDNGLGLGDATDMERSTLCSFTR